MQRVVQKNQRRSPRQTSGIISPVISKMELPGKPKSIKECLELANKVAGISTTKLGAGDAMPFKKDL